VVRDFEPVSLVASQPVIIISSKTLPAANLTELIAWLKANPKASAGNAGIGTASHLAAFFFRKETGTQFQLVPYRGGAPAMQDLLSGQIDLMFDLAANALPQARAGSIRTYAVMAASRIAAAPDIPTVDEAGLPRLYLSLWNGVWAPKGTRKPIIERLNAAIRESLADPAVRRHLIEIGHEIPPADQQTPDALRAYQKTEIEKWWPIITAAGIRGE
jgi:tripartite-type tricarboxylate transporter receptor subunit TctC